MACSYRGSQGTPFGVVLAQLGFDPPALLCRGFALNAGFRGTARSIALDLREWLNKGGFPPRGMTAEEARAKIEEAIRH